MEATGSLQEEHVLSAQSSVTNARKQSLQAAFNLFRTNLETDQAQHKKFLATSEASASRSRSIMIESLEERGILSLIPSIAGIHERFFLILM